MSNQVLTVGRSRRYSLILGLILIAGVLSTVHAQTTSIPHLIRYRGRLDLTQSSTSSLVIAITFGVFAEQQGGTALWSETQQVQVGPDGQFEVLLGSVSGDGLPADLFAGNESKWLSVLPEGQEELKRILMVSVPYALKAGDAETLAGRPASAYMLQEAPPPSHTEVTQGTAATTSNTGAQSSGTVGTGSPNYLAKFIDAATIATSNVIETVTGVGIDVAAPTQKLDVYGRIKLRARGSATSGVWLTDELGEQQLFVGQIALSALSPFGIWHGNAWRLALTSAGDLGVGVGITPAARFDLGGRAMIRASDQGSAGIWLTGSNGTRSLFLGQLGISSNDAFGIWHNNAWRFIVDNTGNVGVGGVPQFPLDVHGRMLLRALGTQPSGTWRAGPSDTPQLFVGQTDTIASAPFGILHGGNWRFILLSNGNIGVGNSSPTEKLEVTGNLKLDTGKIIFPDGSVLSSASSASSSIVPQDSSLQVSTSGNQVQVAVASSGITSTKLADGSVTSAKIADSSITATKLAGYIPPSSIAGTAATLGSNAFVGTQSVQGNLGISGAMQVSGLSQMSNTMISVSDPNAIAMDVSNTASTGNANAIRATTYSNNGSAIYALALPSTGNATALFGRSDAPQGTGVYGEGSDGTYANFGVHGISRSGTGTGVQGEALGTTGPNYGLLGRAAGDNGSAGVFAEATATSTLLNSYGVYARSFSKNGIGVYGYANSLSGNTYGVYGRVDSATGIAGMFMTSASSGNVLAANNSVKRIMRLDASGNFYAAGTLNPNGADYAEMVEPSGDRTKYEPGDVLVIDENADRQVSLSSEPYSTNVAGVFSTQPGILGSRHEMGNNAAGELPVAIVGIVPCKVSTENGTIRRGDLLVTSSTPGYAMKATDRSRFAGAILGKAMQPLNDGSGVIEILVTLE